MLKNMKLGLKMGLGFGLVIILVVIVGGLAIFNMLSIQEQSTTLRDAYVEEVDIANNIERNSLLTMYNMRGYSLTYDESFRQLGDQYLSKIDDYLQAAETLVAKFPFLVKLKEDVAVAKENVTQYEAQAEETVEAIGKINTARANMDQAAATYLEYTGAYLENQEKQYALDLEADVSDTAMMERLRKIYLMNDAIDIANNARVMNFKAQVDNDPSIIQDAIERIDTVKNIAVELRKYTRLESDLEALDEIADARDVYRAALVNMYNALTELTELNVQRGETADRVLAAAQNTAEAGIAGTKNIANEAVNLVATSIVIVIIGLVVALILAIIIAVVLTLGITKAVAKGVSFAQEIAAGDLETQLDVVQKDEIGILADALREMQKALRYKADVVEQIANKDLTVEFKKASEKDGLGESLIVMKDSLNELLGQVDNAVDQVSSGADQVSQASQSLSQGATEQASSLEEISSSTNEVNGQANQNADNATEANALAKKASEDATNGNDQMKDLMEAMEGINASSDEIKKVVKVIDDIAFQINLLALNANVEAARAGKYGKGFAVVAEEVRNLAVRSAEAVQETTSMVEDSINNIQRGNQSAEATAKSLEAIVDGSTKVADFLGEIALASKEQAQAIEQITNGLDQIDQVTQANTASAEESASASEELASQAQQLKAMVAQFKLEKRSGLLTDNRQKGLLTQGTGGQKKSGNTPQQGGGSSQGGPQRSQRTTTQSRATTGNTTQTTQRSSGGGQRTGTSYSYQGGDEQNKEETGIKPMDPAEVIKLDDDDFDNF